MAREGARLSLTFMRTVLTAQGRRCWGWCRAGGAVRSLLLFSGPSCSPQPLPSAPQPPGAARVRSELQGHEPTKPTSPASREAPSLSDLSLCSEGESGSLPQLHAKSKSSLSLSDFEA